MRSLSYSVLSLSTLFGALVHGRPSLLSRQQIWQTLPPTPSLPTPIDETLTSINGVNLWYQSYASSSTPTSRPLVFIHGGLGYSAYFGDVLSELIARGHDNVLAVDRRGHGRSTFNTGDSFTYDMFAVDTISLLEAEGFLSKGLDVVGWSDGAITTLAMLFNSTIAQRINKAFVFGGSAKPEDTNATFSSTDIFSEFVSRCGEEYASLQPTANFTLFAQKVGTLEATLPQWSDADLGTLDGTKITIVGAEHEEAVNLDVPARLNAAIPGSKLVMLEGVSHFAPVQNPTGFADAVEAWLAA